MLLLFFALSMPFSSCEKIETEKENTTTDISSEDIDKNKDDDGDKDDDKGGGSDTPGDDDDSQDGDDNGGSPDVDDGGGEPGGGEEPGGDTPDDTGYHDGDIVSVGEFLKKDIKCAVWVVGRIVGDCTKSKKNAEFDPPFTMSQAILLADDPDEKDINKVVSVCLTTKKTMRAELNLADNPQNKNQLVAVLGYREVYLGLTGIKKPCGYKFPVYIK